MSTNLRNAAAHLMADAKSREATQIVSEVPQLSSYYIPQKQIDLGNAEVVSDVRLKHQSVEGGNPMGFPDRDIELNPDLPDQPRREDHAMSDDAYAFRTYTPDIEGLKAEEPEPTLFDDPSLSP